MKSRAYQTTPTPVLDLLPSLLTTKTNRPQQKDPMPGIIQSLLDTDVKGRPDAFNPAELFLASIAAWKANTEHLEAQRLGRVLANRRKPRTILG